MAMPGTTRLVDVRRATCWTCGREYFGQGGARTARDHAAMTGHEVTIEELVRETLNMAVSERPFAAVAVFEDGRRPVALREAHELTVGTGQEDA